MSIVKDLPEFTEEIINHNLKPLWSPWSTPFMIRVNEICREIENGGNFPFSKVIQAHSVDPQASGQKPMTFVRQVINLCVNPSLLESDLFPDDAKDRARAILKNCLNCSIGTYTLCFGVPLINQQVADYITLRDGIPASAEDIILFNGATEAFRADETSNHPVFSDNSFLDILGDNLEGSASDIIPFLNSDSNEFPKLTEILEVGATQIKSEADGINSLETIKEKLTVPLEKESYAIDEESIKTGGILKGVYNGAKEIPGEVHNKIKNYGKDVFDRFGEIRGGLAEKVGEVHENVKEYPKAVMNHIQDIPNRVMSIPKFWRRSTTPASAEVENNSRRRGGLFGFGF